MKNLTDFKGFTLIELLVVIAIIGMLSTIIAAPIMSSRKKARTVRRVTDMKAIRDALETYATDYGSYPDTGGAWNTECSGLSANSVIPGLVPSYLRSMPSDPTMNKAANTSCYYYRSNGTDYKLLDLQINEFSNSDYAAQPTLLDTWRDGGTHPAGDCVFDGTTYTSWQISTPGGACW